MPKVAILKKRVILGVEIDNFLAGGKGVKTTTIWQDEKLEKYSYVDKTTDEVEQVTGRVSDVVLNVASTLKQTAQKYLLRDVCTLKSVVVDTSAEFNSSFLTIPKDCMLELIPGSEEKVDDAAVYPVAKLIVNANMSDDSWKDLELHVGDDLYNAMFTLAGQAPKIQVGNFRIKEFLYSYSTASGLDITGLILTAGDNEWQVKLSDIKQFGNKAEVVTDLSQLATAISTALDELDNNGVVITAPGEFSDPLTLTKSIAIKGVQADVAANSGERANDSADPEVEDVLKGAVGISEGAVVNVTGMTLNGDALIMATKPKEVVFTNCKFVGLSGSNNQLFETANSVNDVMDPVKLVVKNCYFGNNDNVYHVFNLNFPLADGSIFANNYFAKAACTHNVINIYNVADGATVTISGNTFEYSANAIRIGTAGSPVCKIDILNNKYLDTDMSDGGKYGGLLIIQPCLKETVSMAGVTINIKGTTPVAEEDLFYLYANLGSETDIINDESLRPVITVNGKVVPAKDQKALS